MNEDHHPVGRPSGESGTMTPPINSVSDHILQGIAAGDLAASPFEVVSIAKELAARRAANTPVDGWVLVPRKATDQMYVAFRDQLNEGGHIYRFVEAYEAMLAAAPTSPAAEPASVCDGQLCYYHGCQGLAECAQGKPHHPAPSASREVADEMVERAAQELLAHGEFSSIPWRNHDNALKAARAALLAALPEREG